MNIKAKIIKTGVEIEIEVKKSRTSNDIYISDKWGNQYKPNELEIAEGTFVNGSWIDKGYRMENLIKI